METDRAFWVALAFYGGVAFLAGVEALVTATATASDWGHTLGGSLVAMTAGAALHRGDAVSGLSAPIQWLGIAGALVAGLATLWPVLT